jgi:hypothetical protein
LDGLTSTTAGGTSNDQLSKGLEPYPRGLVTRGKEHRAICSVRTKLSAEKPREKWPLEVLKNIFGDNINMDLKTSCAEDTGRFGTDVEPSGSATTELVVWILG